MQVVLPLPLLHASMSFILQGIWVPKTRLCSKETLELNNGVHCVSFSQSLFGAQYRSCPGYMLHFLLCPEEHVKHQELRVGSFDIQVAPKVASAIPLPVWGRAHGMTRRGCLLSERIIFLLCTMQGSPLCRCRHICCLLVRSQFSSPC